MKVSLFQGVLFGVFGLFALIGLFVFATHTSNTVRNAGSVGSVVIWGTLPDKNMQFLINKSMQTNSDFKGVSYVRKNQQNLSSDLASAIATGNAPDLILDSQESLHSISKLIIPIPYKTLSATAFTSSFVGGADILTAPNNGGYYGVPFLVDTLVLFSNSAILSSSGIAKPPATWEALTGLVPKITKLTSTKQINRGLIALGTYDNVRNARAILSSLFLQSGVPISYYKNGLLVANLSGTNVSGGITPGNAVLRFYTQFTDPSKVSYTWNSSLSNSRQAFINGDLALYIGYVSEARFLTIANPNLTFKVTPLPQQATARTKTAYGLIYSFMIPRGASNISGAYKVATLFTESSEQNLAVKAFGFSPTSINSLSNIPSSTIASVAYAEALYTKGWLSPMPVDTNQVFSSMINNVVSGRLSVGKALISSAQTLSSLMQK